MSGLAKSLFFPPSLSDWLFEGPWNMREFQHHSQWYGDSLPLPRLFGCPLEDANVEGEEEGDENANDGGRYHMQYSRKWKGGVERERERARQSMDVGPRTFFRRIFSPKGPAENGPGDRYRGEKIQFRAHAYWTASK